MSWVLDQHKRVYWNRGPWFIFESLSESEQMAALEKLNILDQQGLNNGLLQIHKIGHSNDGGIYAVKLNEKKRILISEHVKNKSFYILDIINVEAMKIFNRGSNE